MISLAVGLMLVTRVQQELNSLGLVKEEGED